MYIRVGAVLLVLAASAAQASADVTVYLERNGAVTEDGVEMPPFGGGDRTWRAVVACVRQQYAPFAVDIVDAKPQAGSYITAVVGGRASLLGLEDDTTNGVGPYDGNVIRDAVVYVFSQVGPGERDVENLCAVTAHEVGHVLGLDHEVYCGDVMSYYVDQCGARTFIDVDAPCGEADERSCGSGEDSQNSYRRLAQLVGLRGASRDDTAPPQQRYADDAGDWDADDADDRDDSARYDVDEARVPRRHHHFHSRNVSRSSDFLNLPADVRGIDSTNTKASGSQNFAKRGARKARRSSPVHVAPGRRTTAATGRSPHRG